MFDRICGLPEYYPTGAERAILAERSQDIAALTGAAEVVELGSGTAAKSRLLLSALTQAGTLRRYVPVDVTEGMIRATGTALAAEYPGLDELSADFEPESFDHVAFFSREHEWIEMRLRAQRRMTVNVAAVGLAVDFGEREELRTEISAKFTPRRLAADLAAAGLECAQLFTDPDGLFGLALGRPVGSARSEATRGRVLAAAA